MTRTPQHRVALVAGASGVVGRAIVDHLSSNPDWDVVALSRRPMEGGGRVVTQSVDLRDASSCTAAAPAWADITHVFYTAYLPNSELEIESAHNTQMLINLVSALEPAATNLRHIQLMQGSKWYGNHLGPYKTPAQEDDPRHSAPCFYYGQQDWLEARARGKAWTWSALRPHGVLGLAIGSSMNQLTAMALYASVMKELDRPLSWPGSEAAFNCVYQFTEAAYLARGAEWAATEPRMGNAAHNFTNGDVVRWSNLWPAIAAAFGMKCGPPKPQKLSETMPQHEALWASICARHGLENHSLAELTNWRFADFVFHCGYDQISDLTRARNAGWMGANPSQAMYVRLIGDLRTRRIIP